MDVEAGSTAPQVPARFEIKGELGRGGMAVVYHAYDTIGERDVALKFLPPTEDSSLKKRFQREAVDLAAVYHPNVVEFYALGESGGQEFIEMEYVGNGTLSQFQRKTDSLKLILEVYAQIAEGLDHIHGRGLVHRDIKPANILMSEEGTPKISDLGLARREEGRTQLTQDGTILGTASYVAPEQLMSHAVGSSADTYALGVCLFEAVTCRQPFRAGSMLAMLRAHLEEKPPRPSAVLPGLPESLDRLILSMMEKKAEQRPQDLVKVAADLREIAASLSPTQDGLAASSPKALLGRVRLHINDGDPAEAMRLLEELEVEIDEDSELRAELLCERARLLILQKDDGATAAANRAVEECRSRNDLKALGAALVLCGQAATREGDWDSALAALQEARELVPSSNLDLQVELMESLAELHTVGSDSGHPKLAPDEAQRFRDIASGLLQRRSPGEARAEKAAPAQPTRKAKSSPKPTTPGKKSWAVPAAVAGLLLLALLGYGGYRFANRPAVLEVVSEPPGARVTVNGEDFISPYKGELAAGPHNLTVYLKGYHAKKEKLELKAGETLRMTAALEPSSGAANLTSKPPGAEVFLDGQPRGKTPVELTGLPIKKYKVKLKMEGYKPHEDVIEVLGGKTRNLEFALTELPKPAPTYPVYQRPTYSSSSRPASQPRPVSQPRPSSRPAPPPRQRPTYRPPQVNIPRIRVKKPKIKIRF